jgi:hypothetical protein
MLRPKAVMWLYRTHTLPRETTQVGVFPANPWITQPKTKTRADIGARACDWWWLA